MSKSKSVRPNSFSDREKRFILEHVNRLGKRAIATELSKRFPEDNGGFRSHESIKSFLYRMRHKP